MSAAVRACQACGKPLERKRWADGKPEAPSAFARRRFCSHACSARAQHATARAKHPRPTRTIAPRDPAAPKAERDTRSDDEFMLALEKATDASLREKPERQPWGISTQRRNRQVAGAP